MFGKIFSNNSETAVRLTPYLYLVYFVLLTVIGMHAFHKGNCQGMWKFLVSFVTFLILSMWVSKYTMDLRAFVIINILFFSFYLRMIFLSDYESFENSEEDSKKKEEDDKKEKEEKEEKVDETVETSETAPETSAVEVAEDENTKVSGVIEESAVKLNIPETVATAFSQFSPEQMRNMTRDTKELLETQKALTDTLKSLTPIVSQGVKLVDAFKDGSSNMEKIKNMGDIANIFK